MWIFGDAALASHLSTHGHELLRHLADIVNLSGDMIHP